MANTKRKLKTSRVRKATRVARKPQKVSWEMKKAMAQMGNAG
jgi:hypothetical protein